MFYLAFITSFVASLFLTFMLKVLEYFKFIKWDPVGYTKKLNVLENAHESTQWMVLWFMIFILTLILYLVMQFVVQVPPFLTSLLIGGLIALVTEWIIYNLDAELSSFKKLSVPFMIVVIITSRFVFETATFHYQANHNRNKLPYKDTMIK